MANQMNKVAAIFGNHQNLKDTLDDLNRSGFNKDEISVLIKRQPDDTEVETDEIRTYSTGTYPSATLDRPRMVENTKTAREVEFTDPVLRDRNLGYDPVTGTALPAENFVPAMPRTDIAGVDAGTAYNSTDRAVFDRDVVLDKDREVVVDEDIDKNRLDKNVSDENEVAVKDPNALMRDSMAGGALGLLAGAAALLIPGVGPVIAAGPVAAAIAALASGAAVGTTAGALMGLFQDEGIPSDRVDTYRAAFEAGKAIVIIKPKTEGDDISEMNLARSIINRHNPEMVELID